MLKISDELAIPDNELHFSFSRSGGPGGQNVNKVNSKATLRWSVVQSASMPESVRQRFLSKYGSRLTKEGSLILSSQKFRDQPKNVDDCLQRLVRMLQGVLYPQKPRRPTKPTRGSRERRLHAKRHQSAKKGLRGSRREDS